MRNILLIIACVGVFTGCAHNHKDALVIKEGIVKEVKDNKSIIKLDTNTEIEVNKVYKVGETVKIIVK